MGSVGFPLKLSACILFFLILENSYVACDNHWCYDKPECGPSTWGTIGSCSGTRQSPINIDTGEVIYDSRLGPIRFTGYEDRKIINQMKNKGYQDLTKSEFVNLGKFKMCGLQFPEFPSQHNGIGEHITSWLGKYITEGSIIQAKSEITFHPKATISSPSLPAVYFLVSAHWHWGTQNTSGAEHTINGHRCAMEMHLVHTKNNMSLEDAKKELDGLVVMAFLIEISEESNYITPWTTVAKLLQKIPEKGNTWDLNGEFSMGGLLKTADLSTYIRYRGSLTSPNCEEAVIWIVFLEPLWVSYRVIKIMTTSLYFTTAEEKRRMQNNFRPVQPLNGRNVYYYQEHKTLSYCMRRCFSIMF